MTVSDSLVSSQPGDEVRGLCVDTGGPASAHPYPQDTIPDSCLPHMKGPPESPWQESLPPSSSPAQIMESAISFSPYALRQASSSTTGTVTFCRILARLPREEVVPQPDTIHSVPASYSSFSSGRAITSITSLERSASSARSRVQMSL